MIVHLKKGKTMKKYQLDSFMNNFGPARKFMLHQFENRVRVNGGLPRILLTNDVYDDMYILVDEVDKEVGWVGNVERIGNDFLIKKIFLLDQESHATTCEITADGLAGWASQLISERENGLDIVNSLRFWGHSHVNMGTNPSCQDDQQMSVFSEACEDFFIRGILNKLGRIEFTLYLFEMGFEIEDCTWEIFNPAIDEARRIVWQKEIKEKVRTKLYSTQDVDNLEYFRQFASGKKSREKSEKVQKHI